MAAAACLDQGQRHVLLALEDGAIGFHAVYVRPLSRPVHGLQSPLCRVVQDARPRRLGLPDHHGISVSTDLVRYQRGMVTAHYHRYSLVTVSRRDLIGTTRCVRLGGDGHKVCGFVVVHCLDPVVEEPDLVPFGYQPGKHGH